MSSLSIGRSIYKLKITVDLTWIAIYFWKSNHIVVVVFAVKDVLHNTFLEKKNSCFCCFFSCLYCVVFFLFFISNFRDTLSMLKNNFFPFSNLHEFEYSFKYSISERNATALFEIFL